MGNILRIIGRCLDEAAEPRAETAPTEELICEAIFGAVLVLCVLCAFIVVTIAVLRYGWLRRGTSGVRPGTSGVSKKNLQLLPKFTYSTTTTTSSSAAGGMLAKFASSECAICLEEFMEGDEVRVLAQCGHGFHVKCIDKWLGSHSCCPFCRRILVMPSSSSTCGGAATELELRGSGENNTSSDNNNVSSFLP